MQAIGPLLGVQILYFHAIFPQNICKIIGFMELAPPPQENTGSTTASTIKTSKLIGVDIFHIVLQ